MLGRSTTRHSQRPVLETFEERVLFKKKEKKENKITVDLYFALRFCSISITFIRLEKKIDEIMNDFSFNLNLSIVIIV